MTDLDELRETLRAFAQGQIDKVAAIVEACGTAGAYGDLARADVAYELFALLDKLPPATPLTSPERIPPAIRAGLDRYAQGIRPGSCLQAILRDELFEAFKRADPETMVAMPAIVAYVRNQLPVGCWGCEALVEAWIARPRS